MSIKINIAKSRVNGMSLDDCVECNYATSNFSIIDENENNFHVELFSGKVVMVQMKNLGWHDDFRPGISATVFDNEEEKKITFSTEYYGDMFASFADIDGDLDAYRDFIEYKSRKARVSSQYNLRKKFKNHAKEIYAGEVTYHKFQELYNFYGTEKYDEIIKLLTSFKNERLRSKFRKSLASQLYHWILDPAPKYKKPLSPNQTRFLVPYNQQWR